MKKSKEISIQITDLCKNYGAIKASSHINLTAYNGEIIALLGPNGAGKSTLMNMIAGYLAPTSGNIIVLGKNIAQYPIFAKQNIGFLPEGAPLYPDLSVRMFLNYMAELRGEGKNMVQNVAQTANITDVMEQKIETLSKGYLRRVGFAQSILSNPPILLLDEPTDGLDPNQIDYMRQLIGQMAKNKTIIISTHLLEEAETVCNRIVLLHQGIIKADGSLKQILKQTATKKLADAFRRLTEKEA
ncbi:MAG: ABC transporter ATP-binding protein [Alphaproteobacteria bacterium]|nr:ABC transporter ATP-binding protein [Alphaproteobacteria bacterium]